MIITKRDMKIIALYKKEETLQEIGDIYSISRQRINQILRKYSHLFKRRRIGNDTDKVRQRPIETYITNQLLSKRFKVIPQAYNNPYDLLVNGKRVEIKYSSRATHGSWSTKSLYFKFTNITTYEPVDYFLLICGEKKYTTYIVPAYLFKETINLNIPEYGWKGKSKWSRLNEYKNKWDLLRLP